ncbi:hypothetical protein K440DRAFT_657801 [Wilcoxina mikolae CBS 423.85]|nr:hypothetical protein K440DRAFT_657801 [Wilcoxina mikolae CBS 423.85]
MRRCVTTHINAENKFGRLLPHAVTALEHASCYNLELFNTRWHLENRVGIYHDITGRYDGALKRYKRAFDGYEKALGKDHPSTLNTIGNMALVFEHQGEYDKALEWYQRALDGKEKALGKDHPSTLRTIKNIARTKGHLSTPADNCTVSPAIATTRPKWRKWKPEKIQVRKNRG